MKRSIPAAAFLAAALFAGAAGAEVSVSPSRETAVITAASMKVGNEEVLVLIDRSAHIMRVYSFRNLDLRELDGSPVNLAREFNPPVAGKTPVLTGLAPSEYLIIPVGTGSSSLLCIVNSQTKRLLVAQVNGQRLQLSKAVDLKKEFELK